MSRLLVTGGSGLLGSNLSKLAAAKFDVYATYNTHETRMDCVNFFQIDLTKKGAITKIEKISPGFIIHCAAMTDVDYCQGHPRQAHRQNVIASIYTAEAAKKTGAYLIYISTDSVFDGEKGDYKESDKLNPINVYGKTKLEAERAVLSICPHACVVRTNFYGWNKIDKFSLAEWMLSKLKNNEELPALEDIYFSPILVNDLAEILLKLQEKKYEGVIHVAGSEPCSKLDFAYNIAQIFGFDRNLIKPVSMRQLGLTAPRGRDISLNTSRVAGLFKERPPGVKEGLKQMRRLHEGGYVKELKNE